ncbi:MAG: hypothetical protein IT381_26200 [Deltaproteobacteria bacterium]|nr:hypothetical protein [Deltaproteobacteria bacterium]
MSWIGDHGHHVHVYKDGKQVLKWDLGEAKAISGKSNARLAKIIGELQAEGRL